MSLRSTLDLGTAGCLIWHFAKTAQGRSMDGYRYLQLVAAIHATILLRRGSSCRQMTEIAAHFTQIRAVTPC